MGVFTSSKVVKGREEYIIETHTLIEHLVRGALSADAGAREARRGRKTDAGARATAMLWRARRSEHMQGHADTSDVSETIPEGHVV